MAASKQDLRQDMNHTGMNDVVVKERSIPVWKFNHCCPKQYQTVTNNHRQDSGAGASQATLLKLKLGPLGRTIPLKNSNANPLGLDSEGQRMYDALATLKLTRNVYFDDFIIHGNLIGSSSPESENVPDLSGDTEEQHDSSDVMLDILGHDERRGLLRDFLVASDLVLKESVENTYSVSFVTRCECGIKEGTELIS